MFAYDCDECNLSYRRNFGSRPKFYEHWPEAEQSYLLIFKKLPKNVNLFFFSGHKLKYIEKKLKQRGENCAPMM